MSLDFQLLGYALLVVPILLAYLIERKVAEARHAAILQDAQDAGLVEPNTLHPVIDASKCIGCAACVQACPEGDVLGLINQKATLIDPTRCIGHGVCKDACPLGAIDLVFGTATRGVDIPFVDHNFQTNVPGIYLAGEIGGMGLIRNAIAQGVQAVDAIATSAKRDQGKSDTDMLDLLIVGAGPAGIAASLAAKQRGLRFETIEQGSLGGTVAHYPRHKVVMTEPAVLPLYGEIRKRVISKEQLLAIWEDVVAKTGLQLRCQERVEGIDADEGGFVISTSADRFRARRVLLAIGRRGTPRRLDVPGEDLTKVTYGLVDPAQYIGRRVLVVGGGDAALEAACTLAEQPGTRVTLAYRRTTFARARKQNRDLINDAVAKGKLKLYLDTTIQSIEAGPVFLDVAGTQTIIPNDDVIICAGGVLPSAFLAGLGIRMERHFGRDRPIELLFEAAA